MLYQVLSREIVLTNFIKNATCLTNSYLAATRFKSENAALTKIPDCVQVLKPVKNTSASAALRIKTINKAMKAYLERARSYENFLKVKNDEFEIGRQHLANIMGIEAETMTQYDIDKAIEYLLPSGLYEKKARPLMKPPKELFPREKAAQFDNSGRPFNTFFYTTKCNYNSSLHELIGKFHELDEFEDKMIAKGILSPPKDALLALSGHWKTLDEVKEIFLENIHEMEYAFLIKTLERLVNHPYSFRCKDEIMKFRKDFAQMNFLESIPELLYDENGRPYIKARGKRKHCIANVTMRGNGTGKIVINGTDIFFFERVCDREQIMAPLTFTKMIELVDIEVDVSGVGSKAQSGAVRLGIAFCLRSFVEPNLVEKMRLVGLLTIDNRWKARKMYGQKGARAKFTWKKR